MHFGNIKLLQQAGITERSRPKHIYNRTYNLDYLVIAMQPINTHMDKR
jgi:hypothetical protein